MQLVFKTFILLFILTSNLNAFSQEKAIVTKFNQDGVLYQSLDESSESIANFKENENCIVISYLGDYVYKIKYKEFEGFVKDQFLIVNEAMMDLFFENEEKERLKAIAEKEKRQKKIREITNVGAEIENQRKLDSVAKIKDQQKKRAQEALEIARDYQNLINQQKKQDSINKEKEEQRIAMIALENKKIKQDQINKKRSEDSIAKVENLKKTRAQNMEYDRLEKLKAIQKTKDSIQKIKDFETKQLLALEAAKVEEEKLAEQKKKDSIAKVENLKKIRAQNMEYDRLEKLKAIQKTKDSVQKIKDVEIKQLRALEAAKIEEEKLAEQKKKDSIAKAENLKKIRAQNMEYDRLEKLKAIQKTKDSIQKIEEAKSKQLFALEAAKIKEDKLAEQKKEDSITKAENIIKIRDSISKAEKQEKKQIEIEKYTKRKQEELLAEQKKQDSIANLNKNNPESLVDIKFRNTCHYLINEYDDFNKRYLKITDKYEINETLNIELIKEGSSKKVHINFSKNLGCVDYVPNTRSSVRITLENTQVIILYHSGSLDCNDFSLKAELSESKINQLKNSPIKSFNLRGTKGSVTISDIDYNNFFIDKLKCIE